MKLLIADDDKVARLFLSEVLVEQGFDVIVAADGEEALACLSDTGAPRLAILDWMMPKLDGIEVTRKIRETRAHGDIYIIIITGLADEDSTVTALESGADDFLRKPYRRLELLARVRAGIRIINLYNERLSMIHQLQHAQKMESIGQLAAGIAHEINTPVQYIGDNTRFMKASLEDLLDVVAGAQKLGKAVHAGTLDEQMMSDFETLLDNADLAFLSEQIPLAVAQSLDGLKRVSDIVSAMKEFAHPGTGERASFDLNHMISSITTVTRNEWKYVSELSLELAPDLPPVPGFVGDLSQALINLIVNAAHAIEEKRVSSGVSEKGRIVVQTRNVPALDAVEIRITDNGSGIRGDVRGRIFDPFFTTKEVGKGTGQGLAIAYSVVVDKHLGRIFFDTEVGEGTTFTIQLPLGEVGLKRDSLS